MGELGRLVQAYRDQQKYPVSDAQIAKAIGVSRSSVGNWIKGDAVPSPANLRALAQHIETSYMRVFEAAMADAGYLPKERDGDAEHATSMTPARGLDAAGAPSKDQVELAAMAGTPAYAERDATGEDNQDPGHDDPA